MDVSFKCAREGCSIMFPARRRLPRKHEGQKGRKCHPMLPTKKR
jgi:hypothetical protein